LIDKYLPCKFRPANSLANIHRGKASLAAET
jgi:hypothetical protein